MRYPFLLRGLPFLSVPYGPDDSQPGDVGYDLPRPQFVRRGSASTVTAASISSNIPTSTITIVTFLTPSPSASPIPITLQSQTVTSYIPKLTACPISSPVIESSLVRRKLQPSASASASTLLFSNLSTTAEPQPSCSVLYSPIVTPICHTTLTPLGGVPITVSDCTQPIAFKTDYGLHTPANATAVLVPTTYLAPWNSVISGVPKGLVEAVICPLNLPCTTMTETWYTQTFEAATTSISTVDINTALIGVCVPLIAELMILVADLHYYSHRKY